MSSINASVRYCPREQWLARALAALAEKVNAG